MLCPEVWKFRIPSYWSQTTQGEFKNNNITFNNEIKTWNKIKSVNFNHMVTVIIPTESNPATLDLVNDLKEDCEYYKVSDVSCSEFVQTNFLKTFVLCGELLVLSVERKIDTDDCFCITSTGFLILSLNKISYQQLGIDGRISAYHKYSKSRYLIEINLHQIKLNSKSHKHLLERLNSLRFDVILSWTPPQSTEINQQEPTRTICPSTIAKYFHDKQYSVTLNQPTFECKLHHDVQVPRLPKDHDSVEEYMEWCGMLAIGGNMKEDGGAFDNYVSTYAVPEVEHEMISQKQVVGVLMWRGFFTSDKIRNMLEKIRISRSETNLWASIYVQGFSDSPVNFGKNEHHYYTSGEYGYFVDLTRDTYSFTEFRVSNKQYRRYKSNNSKSK